MLQREHSAILWTFIKLPFVIKIFVLSFLEWSRKTGFTVLLEYFLLKQEGREGVRVVIMNNRTETFEFEKENSKHMIQLLKSSKYRKGLSNYKESLSKLT